MEKDVVEALGARIANLVISCSPAPVFNYSTFQAIMKLSRDPATAAAVMVRRAQQMAPLTLESLDDLPGALLDAVSEQKKRTTIFLSHLFFCLSWQTRKKSSKLKPARTHLWALIQS